MMGKSFSKESNIDIYKNVGKFIYNSKVNKFENVDPFDVFELEYKLFFENNKKIILSLAISCCDTWEISETGSNYKEFKEKKYKKNTLKNMDGKEIEYIKIVTDYQDQGGTITLFSKNEYCKLKFSYIHNGKYLGCLNYYTNLDKSN